MRTATVRVDAERVSVARSLAALARASARDGGPLVCLTARSYADLCTELGSDEAAARPLFRVATNTARPIAVNLPTGPETSTTVFVAPRAWTDERLAGWAAGHHEALEAAFGAAKVRRREAAMSDEALRLLTEEERQRMQRAMTYGGMCGLCGRALALDEPVWVAAVDAYGDARGYWRAPVGRECAPPALLHETEGTAPAGCAGCGRGVYAWRTDPRRHAVTCSRRCRARVADARRREDE